MEPRIQYATSSDGMKIAFSAIGRGPILLYLPQPLMVPLQTYEQVPAIHSFVDRLAESFQVVRFDHRGSGLSTRSADSFVMEPLLRDVEAVIDKLGAKEINIFAEFDSGPIAIWLAANHPGLVKKLILWCSWSRSLDVFDKDTWAALNSLLDTNMQLYFETMAQGSFGGTGLDVRETIKPSMEGVEQETLKKALKDFWLLDASDLLGGLRCPTLVLHREGLLVPLTQSIDLASRIPEGRFVVLPGIGGEPWAGDVDEVIRSVEGFLLPERVIPNPDRPKETSPLRTVLFTDLVGHTEMMQRLGDKRGREVLREHERITREKLKAHCGTEIKTDGDSFMISFTSVASAVECAVELQRAFAEHEGEPLSVRMGLNAGEPVEEDGDLFGATVILSSRIAAKAGGGEILVADTVRGLCSGKGFLFADRGDFVAKGIEEPVRISEVSWRR